MDSRDAKEVEGSWPTLSSLVILSVFINGNNNSTMSSIGGFKD